MKSSHLEILLTQKIWEGKITIHKSMVKKPKLVD